MKTSNLQLQSNDTLHLYQSTDASNATQENSNSLMHIQPLSPSSLVNMRKITTATTANTGKFSDDNEKNKRALEALKQNYFNFQSRVIAQAKAPIKASIIHQLKTKYNKRKVKRKTKINHITEEALSQLEKEVRLLRKIKNDMEDIEGKRNMLNRFLIETIPDKLCHLRDSLVYIDNNNNSNIDEIENRINSSMMIVDSGANENISKDYIREVKSLVKGYTDLNNFYHQSNNKNNHNRFNNE